MLNHKGLAKYHLGQVLNLATLLAQNNF